jgi:hypothetical protein
MGTEVPFWDSRDEFGDTALVVVKPDEGASLARALGPHWTVLMGRHGATVCGTSLQECVFRTIYGAKNAELQTQALVLGHVEPLSAAEAELARTYNLRPGPIGRAWDYWTRQLAKAEGRIAPVWAQSGAVVSAKPTASPPVAKPSAKPAPAKKPAKVAAKPAAKPKLPLRPLTPKGKVGKSKTTRR